MATKSTELTVEISIKDLDEVKTLIRKLREHFDDLPDPVQLYLYSMVGDGDIEIEEVVSDD